MPKYGLIACFSPVIKIDIGEHKFDANRRYRFGKIWGGGKWKEVEVLAIQKVATTVNTGKKLRQAISIM